MAVRALVIAAIGLLLGPLTSGLAVILTYYGVLFLLGLPFLGMRARTLFVLAGVWAVVAPVVSYLVRPTSPARGFANPDLVDQLSDPAQFLSELTFTGYYPVLPWLAYLLAGMGLGRLDLNRQRVQAWIAASGAVLCLGAAFCPHSLTSQDRVARGPPLGRRATGWDGTGADRADPGRHVRQHTGRWALAVDARGRAAQQHAVRPLRPSAARCW